MLPSTGWLATPQLAPSTREILPEQYALSFRGGVSSFTPVAPKIPFTTLVELTDHFSAAVVSGNDPAGKFGYRITLARDDAYGAGLFDYIDFGDNVLSYDVENCPDVVQGNTIEEVTCTDNIVVTADV